MMTIPPSLLQSQGLAEPQGLLAPTTPTPPDQASLAMAAGQMDQAGALKPPRIYNHAKHSRWRNG